MPSETLETISPVKLTTLVRPTISCFSKHGYSHDEISLNVSKGLHSNKYFSPIQYREQKGTTQLELFVRQYTDR